MADLLIGGLHLFGFFEGFVFFYYSLYKVLELTKLARINIISNYIKYANRKPQGFLLLYPLIAIIILDFIVLFFIIHPLIQESSLNKLAEFVLAYQVVLPLLMSICLLLTYVILRKYLPKSIFLFINKIATFMSVMFPFVLVNYLLIQHYAVTEVLLGYETEMLVYLIATIYSIIIHKNNIKDSIRGVVQEFREAF